MGVIKLHEQLQDKREIVTLLGEYDRVKIVKLIQKNRPFDGTENVRRLPQIGDIATICHKYDSQDSTAFVAVEMVDKNGLTIWLTDFMQEELELVQRA